MDAKELERFRVRDTVRQQASGKRKTVDLDLLRQAVLDDLNTTNRLANKNDVYDGYGWQYGKYFAAGQECSYLAGYTSALESVLHILNGYHGYNSRNWLAFCNQPDWHKIITFLNDYDQEHNTSHYWKLLDILDRRDRHAPKVFYGTGTHPPTPSELARAARIASHYARFIMPIPIGPMLNILKSKR